MSLLSASESCWTGHLFALCSTCLGLTVWDRGTFATRGRDLMETSQRTVFWLNMVSCVKVNSCYLQQKKKKQDSWDLTRILRYLVTETSWKTKLWREKLRTDRVCLFVFYSLLLFSDFTFCTESNCDKSLCCYSNKVGEEVLIGIVQQAFLLRTTASYEQALECLFVRL